MGEIGQVIEVVEHNKIKVKLKRVEACAKCKACTAGFSQMDMFIVAENLCDAKLDEKVNIELESKYYYKAVFIMYFIPLVNLILGFVSGLYLARYFNMKNQELVSFFCGILLMVLTYLIIKLVHLKKGDDKIVPVATYTVD